MAEFVDAGPRNVFVGVIHHGRALKIRDRQDFLLEVQGAPRQGPGRVSEVAVQRPRVHDRHLGREVRTDVEKIGVQLQVDQGRPEKSAKEGAVALRRQALVGVGEVAVVEGVAHGQPRDDVGAQFPRVGLPLLGRVAAHQGLVQRSADQRDGLLFQVAGRRGRYLLRLVADQLPGLVRREVAAEIGADRAQVDGHRIHIALEDRVHAVLVTGERSEPVDVVPDPFIRRVEQVRPVPVDFDPGLRFLLGPGIAARVGTAFEYQHAGPVLTCGGFGNGQSEEACADDNEVGTVVSGRYHFSASAVRHGAGVPQVAHSPCSSPAGG